MPKVARNIAPPTAGKSVDNTVALDGDGWFEPVVIAPPPPKPVLRPEPKRSSFRDSVTEAFRKHGMILPPKKEVPGEGEIPNPGTGDAEKKTGR